jgi:hypothetical protein
LRYDTKLGGQDLMDFLWFWVIVAVGVEFTRRTVNSCNSKKANSDLDNLKKPLLEHDQLVGPVDKSECNYSCCSPYIYNFTDGDESFISTESTDETVSSEEVEEIEEIEEIEESEENLVDKRRAGKQLASADPGRSKLVHFKISDTHFTVNGTATVRLAREDSTKIHPHPDGVDDQFSSSMLSSSSNVLKEKLYMPSDEIVDECTISQPIQDGISSH